MRSNSSIFRLVLSLALVAVLASTGALARSAKKGETTISVPIFFATDREKLAGKNGGITFGRQLLDPADGMYYGMKRVDVFATAQTIDDDRELLRWGWRILQPAGTENGESAGKGGGETADNADAGRDCEIAQFDEQVFDEEGTEKLISMMRKAISESQRKEFLVFVHGCCVDFEESMKQSAALENSVKVPVVAYCWGCTKGNYPGSLLAYPRSQERFNKFLTDILKAFPKERISIVGNSIGNSLVINFCAQRRPEETGRQINDIFMSRADVDAFAFKSQLKYIRSHSNNIILYVARNDPQINISGVLRWLSLPAQHGERVGNLRSMLQTEPSLTVLDVSPLKMGHSIPCESISDILKNHGTIPQQSDNFVYTREADNLVRVTRVNKPKSQATKNLATPSARDLKAARAEN